MSSRAISVGVNTMKHTFSFKVTSSNIASRSQGVVESSGTAMDERWL